ncbi:MAG TPA: hypothetical protein DCE80_10460 [Ignavibacteriales bacterium]|uniref:Radical SAM domain-containing protein n=1 Tax=Candidatus Daviesbacteria bacterium GW2011_GWF2_38_6 TaxID=1618432 RepID=A0A0G0MSP9_9BACT|nr:MAG: radical SAM domain-containing protein [Candidatus Daviesbacteria bacterium GW2011_GWF2_38_6]HAB52573.1 hypothetical protein [Ignavibacteriales bacterium]
MALGFSGSNGGMSINYKQFFVLNLKDNIFYQKNLIPTEVSYFINNICNLKCIHCYVGYCDSSNALSIQRWKDVFSELIDSGARTFGNVGKEPLLSWHKTRDLLHYFKTKRSEIPTLRFGFVTNGILLDEHKIIELESIKPDYIDISLDGNRKTHDWIRGTCGYDKLMNNLSILSKYELSKKIFISLTLNKINASSVAEVIETVYNLGIKNILISPYVTLNIHDNLFISNDEIIFETQKLINGELVNFTNYKGLNIYFKNDFTTTRDLMEEMADRNIINKHELLIDNYGVIFNKYSINNNNIYFNYLPWDTSYIQAIRISHNGYVSNCYDMFFENYPERAIGNVREKSIREILENRNVFKKEYAGCDFP